MVVFELLYLEISHRLVKKINLIRWLFHYMV